MGKLNSVGAELDKIDIIGHLALALPNSFDHKATAPETRIQIN